MTSVVAGTGLTGGTITTSGTIGLGAELAAVNGLSSAGFVKRTGAGAYTAVPSVNIISDTTGTLSVDRGGTGATDAQGAINNFLPSQSGHAGRILQTNGTNVSWVDTPTTGITALTGEVTASGTGSVAATIANGASAIKINPDVSGTLNDGIQFHTSTGNHTAGDVYSSERMRIEPNGNVGIGTSSPKAKLHVGNGDIAVDGGKSFYAFGNGTFGAANATWASYYSNGSESQFVTAGTGTYSSSIPDLQFSKWNGSTTTNMMTILSSSGNVGIGNSNPGEKLQVAGAVKVTGPALTAGASMGALDYYSGTGGARILSWGANTSTPGTFGIWQGSSDASVNRYPFVIDALGRVGIGTESPGVKLDGIYWINSIGIGGTGEADLGLLCTDWTSASSSLYGAVLEKSASLLKITQSRCNTASKILCCR
ncbi:MAG: hypothetical protein KF789_12675 [Bdellovibrionaceae bacterium]|nr:hypothetical protein [Pseudobdellovibrionaceae bacterium]